MHVNESTAEDVRAWPLLQRLLFRFFFVYFLLYIAPWNWLARVPGLGFIASLWYRAQNAIVQAGNAWFFQVRDALIPVNGSGDTSWAWAQLWSLLLLAAVGCAIWSVVDHRRTSYPRLGYWLRTMVRYWIASVSLSYGIIKLFALQMPFPTLSQLATPLGDLLPMRLSWLFLGYSAKYQIFSGIMETVAGLLLLYRPTVTLGLFAATGAFVNVVMINLSYDVPVKLFASHILFGCLFLLLLDARRLFDLLVRNRAVPGTTAYEPYFQGGWRRWAARGLKLAFLVFFLILPLWGSYQRWLGIRAQPPAEPFREGIYDVRTFVRNGDTIPPGDAEADRWRDVIFDSGTAGSIGSADTMFWQRYRRGYFRYGVDRASRTATVWRTSVTFDSTYLFTFAYEMPDTNTIRLRAEIRGDSVFAELARSDRHFQLAERQFHWLSEYNR